MLQKSVPLISVHYSDGFNTLAIPKLSETLHVEKTLGSFASFNSQRFLRNSKKEKPVNLVVSESISSSSYWEQFQTAQNYGIKTSKDWFVASQSTHLNDKQFIKSQGFGTRLSRRSETTSLLSEVEDNPFSGKKTRAQVEEASVGVDSFTQNQIQKNDIRPIEISIDKPIRIDGQIGRLS